MAYVSQLLTFLYTIPVGYFLMDVEIKKPEKFKIERGTLIISNHQSKSDPFFITYHIGWFNAFFNLPLRFPTIHTFMDMPLIGLYLRTLYCFRVGATNHEKVKALFQMRDFLKQKHTIVLFPEGQRIKVGNKVESFHVGFDLLLREESIPLVLVRIYYFNNWFIFKRKNNRPKMVFKMVDKEISLIQKREIITDFYRN